MNYFPRVVDQLIEERLAAVGAVVIEGPKACGKTKSAQKHSRRSVLLDVDDAARHAAEVDPALLMEGATPRLFDKWQVAPQLWNHVRRAIDDRQATGQFILTGSSVPTDDVNRHTGAGRFAFVRMRPMTLFETGHSTGVISLKELMSGLSPRSPQISLTLRDISERITVGGWPARYNSPVRDAARSARDYLEQLLHHDLPRMGGSRRDPARVTQLLRSYARNTSTEAPISRLVADIDGGDSVVDRHTVADYLGFLERLMIIEEQPAWSTHLRSRAAVRNSSKRHFVDPSLAIAALGGGPDHLLSDLNVFGLLFESLVVRDLRVYAQPLNGRVCHYRDSYGTEVDVIIELVDGRWAAFEVKLGAGQVEHGVATLTRFVASIDTTRCGPPAALGVICATGLGYVRKDGIAVIPLGSLGP